MLLEVERLNTYYGESRVLQDMSLESGSGRNCGASRSKRHGQEHNPEKHYGSGHTKIGNM